MTPEQEKKYNEVWEQWMAEVDKIPPYEERLKIPKGVFILNDKEANRPYRILERKYIPLLDAILADSGGDANG